MKVSVVGQKQLAAKLQKAARGSQDRVNRAVAEVGEDLLSRSMAVTPLEDGELRQSGYVDHSPGEAVVGFSASHAVYVHEFPPAPETTFTTPGTSSKYLEGPFAENRGRYRDHIIDAARKGLNG